MPERGAQRSERTVLELLPEIEQIGDAKLRGAVTSIWCRAWESSAWDALTEVPKSPELPRKRTLIDHTRAVTQIATRIAEVERATHDVAIDLDAVLAIALLHDVSKVHEFEDGGRPSRTGRLYQHGFLAAHWMAEAGLGADLIHGVIAHTPLSAVVPQTQEAVIVHYADFVDTDVQLLDAGQTLFCKRRG